MFNLKLNDKKNWVQKFIPEIQNLMWSTIFWKYSYPDWNYLRDSLLVLRFEIDSCWDFRQRFYCRPLRESSVLWYPWTPCWLFAVRNWNIYEQLFQHVKKEILTFNAFNRSIHWSGAAGRVISVPAIKWPNYIWTA